MNVVTFDFETYWSNDYSLSHLSAIEYVQDSRFEVISVATKLNNEPTKVVFGDDVGPHLRSFDWSSCAAVAHNGNEFDFLILVWKFDCHPKLFIDTLALLRAKHMVDVGGSLRALSEHYKLPKKDSSVLVATKGKRYEDLTLAEISLMGQYNIGDVENCYALARVASKINSPQEFLLSDMTARMYCYPQFVVDADLVERTLRETRATKLEVLEQVKTVLGAGSVDEARSMLLSQTKFAQVLRSLGVEPPMKISKQTGKPTYALSKTDDEFTALLEHEDPRVQAVAAARIDARSTLLETRLETMAKVASLCDGKMPVPLAYHAATTGRWGGRVLNLQNLPRVERDKNGNPTNKPHNALRRALCAPKGHAVVVSDASGIELRVNHYLWNVQSTQALFEQDPKADLYKEFASTLYHKPKESITKEERQLAKLCLAEGTLVLTKRGEIPIESVRPFDQVWDGVEWVYTLGPVFKGEQYVIEYDGLVATPDHEVWVADGRKLPFAEAAAQSLRLARTGAGGAPLGVSGACFEDDRAEERVSVRESQVHQVPDRERDPLRQPAVWQNERVPVVQSEVWRADMADTANGSCATTLHEPERQRVRKVGGARDLVSVRQCGSGSSVGDREPWSPQGHGDRQDRQQRALRARQSTVGYAKTECGQPTEITFCEVSPVSADVPGSSVRGQHAAAAAVGGADVRPNSGALEYAVGQTKRRVWDLLNCGPRHRFTANGRLVSNCQLGLGYGAGYTTFQRIARQMGGIELSLEEATKIVDMWRATYADIVRGWRNCATLIEAMYKGAYFSPDPRSLVKTQDKDEIVLPSGRRLYYPQLSKTTNDEGRVEYTYGAGKHATKLWQGLVTENLVQAISRDILAYHMIEIDRQLGYKPVHTVHDELVYIAPQSDADALLKEVNRIMRTAPPWLPGIVLYSEGDVAPTYGDAK